MVIVFGDDLITPIDVVSRENFLSLTPDSQHGRFVINSLAEDTLTDKKYKRSVVFSANGNDHVLKAAYEWERQDNKQ